MDRPIYANAFSVSYNPLLQESVITFYHEYPQPEITPVGSDKVSHNFAVCRESVASITLPGKVAKQLGESILKTINKDTVNGGA